MTYQVHITLGDDFDWTLTQTEPDEHGRVKVTDGIRVLTSLDFGWSMVGGLWPRQPDAEAATFQVTVPNFSEVTWEEGDWVSIEVKADTGGPVIARFYGDVTDYKAVSRDRRPGVTISVVAVDPLVRLAELQNGPYIEPGVPWIDPGMLEHDVIDGLWLGHGIFGGLLPPWTSPDDPGDGTGRRMGSLGDPPPVVKVFDFTKTVLDQAVNLTDDTRMIVAPLISSTLPLGLGMRYTLDTILCGDLSEVVVPASAVRREVGWSLVKGQSPGLVVVDSNGGDLAFTGRVTASTGASGDTYESVAVNTYTEAFAQDVADFYAAHRFAPWQIDTLTVPVSRVHIDDLIPAGLFPDWTLDAEDPDRCICYSRAIRITGIDTTRTPDGEDHITGVLTGARCRISGGELELDLTIRRTETTP